MTALAVWLQGPGGALVLTLLALAFGAVIGWAGRGLLMQRRAMARAAERAAGQRADVWLRQLRSAETDLWQRSVAHWPGEHHSRGERGPGSSPRGIERPRRTSTAAFLDPPRWSAPDVSDWTRHMAAELDAALDRLHEDTDQWLADHGIRDRT